VAVAGAGWGWWGGGGGGGGGVSEAGGGRGGGFINTTCGGKKSAIATVSAVMYICIYIYICTCIYLHICIYVCMYDDDDGRSKGNLTNVLKGGPEPLENENNKILCSKREDRFSGHFSDLVQNICSVRFSYLLRPSIVCKAPRDMRKFPQKCQKIAGC